MNFHRQEPGEGEGNGNRSPGPEERGGVPCQFPGPPEFQRPEGIGGTRISSF